MEKYLVEIETLGGLCSEERYKVNNPMRFWTDLAKLCSNEDVVRVRVTELLWFGLRGTVVFQKGYDEKVEPQA
ncbi:MAG: hypothetical protein K2J64_00215 [Desulfovibrio sp.]|nr:hypothetical protein [Desulfovibrio sp.]